MSNVLSREKREQVIALGRLGWSLRRIEQATGVRRETAGEYLRVAGIVVLDNLREGVLAPDIYDPQLNPLYRDVLAHYGVTALPCKVRDPDRKGKVEQGVAHAQKTPLKGKRFESLEGRKSDFTVSSKTNWRDVALRRGFCCDQERACAGIRFFGVGISTALN
jgi:transposase